MTEILVGIFLLLAITILVILVGMVVLLFYEEFADDLEEIYWKWKNKKK